MRTFSKPIVFAAFIVSAQLPALAVPQTVPAGTIAVVTSDGFFVPDGQSGTPKVFAADSSFPGAPDFARPAAEYDRRSDSFLVASGAHLYALHVVSLSAGTYTIQDITPQSAQALDLYDLDLNPGTGELFLLDQTTDTALRFQPPFAAGMSADLAIALPSTARSLAIDSRAYPSALIVGESSQVTRVLFDGSTQLVSSFPFSSGVDQDPQYASFTGTYMCGGNNDIVGRAVSNPSLLISMNSFMQCVPFALAPEDVEWDPIVPRAFVLAEEGLKSFCSSYGIGPNHVVRFPTAQASGGPMPQVMTYAGGSGITGLEGDVALARGDFAFVAPYGEGCAGGAFSAASLDVAEIPTVGITTLTASVQGAAALSSVQLVLGAARASTQLASGCTLFVRPDSFVALGTTNAQGNLTASVSLPAGLPVGTNVYAQAAILVGGSWQLTNALQVHVGN